mmetsp:Transcript_38874/g.57199  ORF Transcript_38874/g.57199 Transcript_38874/m.57199 type:complete len:318 (+) Transcript_38874:27-980(+)
MTETTEQETLFIRIGGPPAVKAAVADFYKRLLDDEALFHFFEGIDVGTLKKHQYKFFEIALSKIPEDLDVAGLMLAKHQMLFDEKGLNETHFDMVAGHLVGALAGLDVPKDLIDEVVGVVGPLRPVFEKGAELALAKRSKEVKQPQDPQEETEKISTDMDALKVKDDVEEEETLFIRIGGPPAVKAAVADFYKRLLDDEALFHFFEGIDVGTLKKHQYKFFEIALSKIPEDLDVAGLMLAKHQMLFDEKGLNETHFDMVAGHLVGALAGLDVPKDLIDEVVGVVGPLRPVFEKGAELALAKKSKEVTPTDEKKEEAI